MHIVRVLAKLEPGGAQLAVLRLSQELRRRHGVSTTLLVGDATPDGMALARAHDVDTVAFRVRARIDPSRNLQWQRSARFATWLGDRLRGADLVHAHMVGAWWASAQAIDGGTPLVASEHNEVNWRPRRVRSLRTAAARVDRFFAMGPAARSFALAAGARPDAIVAARSPVAGLDARPRLGLATPRLTFAGRFWPDKGPDVLIEALALAELGDTTAYLLGDGPMRGQLVDAIARLGLTDRVVVPGWVGDPGTFVAGSAVHVVPSREEAFSQSAVLAMGHGVPVVGSAVDGLSVTLSAGRGLTVAPDDPQALARAISDVLSGRRSTDRQAALTFARRFTPAQVADFHLAEYEALLADRRSDIAEASRVDAVRQPAG